jgi:Uma2 family endonuclease
MQVRGRLTLSDIAHIPRPMDDTRYELIDGELYVSTQPDLGHQFTCLRLGSRLDRHDELTSAGATYIAPGVIFSDEDAVAPDVVWVSRDRLPTLRHPDGKLHGAPDLMVEVLSPGRRNHERDREVKLGQYSRYGVREYWIADWQQRTVQVYRRVDAALRLEVTLLDQDSLTSSLLPGLSIPLAELFPRDL